LKKHDQLQQLVVFYLRKRKIKVTGVFNEAIKLRTPYFEKIGYIKGHADLELSTANKCCSLELKVDFDKQSQNQILFQNYNESLAIPYLVLHKKKNEYIIKRPFLNKEHKFLAPEESLNFIIKNYL
jgi:hypothetical protein